MRSKVIRAKFLEFFESKGHRVVPSAPLVIKNDPTLMFTNAGMNQFKDFFLGNKTPEYRRIVDTQKCLRVSGKHNDLEDVGFDGTHHTMFEMLGNWSFGDYFKKEAIEWSWEFLTKVCNIEQNRLYATVFGGDDIEKLDVDSESENFWLQYVPKDHIVYGNKKDNFWEMGDTGPCGPCTEIHVDLRSGEERAKTPGRDLVNMDDPLVVEIWNNVFIQYNRKSNGSLEPLPERHVDTGMGFERLCMVLQDKSKSYDTDVFTPLIEFVESRTGVKYKGSYDREAKTDVAIRVIVDHIRAVAFTIADGQQPDNGGAGYVIRRILRRAVRYYYSFLEQKEPLMYLLVHVLAEEFKDVFPELYKQKEFVSKTILAEEKSFLRTLEGGLVRIESLKLSNNNIDGQTAFELYDTFGFPLDLTRLIASEKGWTLDEAGYETALQEQKSRSRADAQKEVGDWQELNNIKGTEFVGYDQLKIDDARPVKWRMVLSKGAIQYHLVMDKTPFYAESGGQVGDRGTLKIDDLVLEVYNTIKENDLVIHVVSSVPPIVTASSKLIAEVDKTSRTQTSGNHSAVHLMHAALHQVVGKHALQKGQDVNDKRLRFDFSHFQKLSKEEIKQIENIVNSKIRQNILKEEVRDMPIEDARKTGAMMLFGEKYGDVVRVITFDKDFSVELCGGTHVERTGDIGLFRIVSESAVAAGIRRIEAVTADGALALLDSESELLIQLKSALKQPIDLLKAVSDIQEDNKRLTKELELLQQKLAGSLKQSLLNEFKPVNGINLLVSKVDIANAKVVKDLMFQLQREKENAIIIIGSVANDKPLISILVGEENTDRIKAGDLVKELSSHIKGGGGGQPGFATAGGSDINGLEKALASAEPLVLSKLS